MSVKHIEMVVFDWAGTTIDYGCIAPLDAFVSSFKEYGVDITPEEARAPMGMKKRDHVAAILGIERVVRIWQNKHGRFPDENDIEGIYTSFEKKICATLSSYCTPIPGVIETLEQLRDNGLKIGSTTGYTREMMDIVVPEAKKNGYHPDYLVTSSDVPAGRPYPYMIWSNAVALDVPDLQHIVKVGDTKADIAEGVSAGVWTVAIIEGSSIWALSKEETKALSPQNYHSRFSTCQNICMNAGAHYVIKDITKLPEILAIIDSQIELGKRA
ncbi:phosphonoacetaldehyde hydrolase [Sediminispirochaeta bajacaliforniensis]|uniref:phosphonoacetaldehyde hydrolase n=1 Tax=Sediminispirochaeta bajacaliforniensis TaxID=148 RepID=UPI0005274739